MLVGRVKPGIYPVHGAFYLAMDNGRGIAMKTRQFRQSRNIIARCLNTTLFDDNVIASLAREILSPDERETVTRLRPTADCRDYVATHALARLLLADAADCEPHEVQVRFRFGARP